MPASQVVLTAPLCPQDLLLHNRQAAEQSLCLCCPEPGERGTGVPCLPLTQEEDCKHLPSALGSLRDVWEQGPAFFPFSERRGEPQLDLEPGISCTRVLHRQGVSNWGFPVPGWPPGAHRHRTELWPSIWIFCRERQQGTLGGLGFHGSGAVLH